MSKTQFTLGQWIESKDEIHDDTQLYMSKYADRITALLDEMQADGLSSLVVVNVACDAGGMGTCLSSSRVSTPARVGARFLQLSAMSAGDEEGALMMGEAQRRRAELNQCTRH